MKPWRPAAVAPSGQKERPPIGGKPTRAEETIMNGHDPAPAEEKYTELFAAGEEALAAGPAPLAGPTLPAELQGRLERDLACARLLRQVLRPAGPEAAPGLPWAGLGRFRLLRELGRGGFGVVYLASDPLLGREVALKVPRPEAGLTPELRERFAREARAAAGLEHPNIVPVYEAGEAGPVCFLISAYCPGVSLAQWLKGRTEPV